VSVLTAPPSAPAEEFHAATLAALPRAALEALAAQMQRSVMAEKEQVLKDAEQMSALNQVWLNVWSTALRHRACLFTTCLLLFYMGLPQCWSFQSNIGLWTFCIYAVL
jgi:hypothetical protein